VVDTGRVSAHLASVGVDAEEVPGGVVVIPARAGFGAEWRFVTQLPYPAEARRLPAL
jgi:hypothetical protein